MVEVPDRQSIRASVGALVRWAAAYDRDDPTAAIRPKKYRLRIGEMKDVCVWGAGRAYTFAPGRWAGFFGRSGADDPHAAVSSLPRLGSPMRLSFLRSRPRVLMRAGLTCVQAVEFTP